MPREQITSYTTIFWDFDGVIKSSNDIKLNAFIGLFPDLSSFQKQLITEHHLRNLGVSRFKKIPHYMSIVGQKFSPESLESLLQSFSKSVVEGVILSPWCDGMPDVLHQLQSTHTSFLVSATPTQELIDICSRLDIYNFFCEIHGSPAEKSDTLQDIIKRKSLAPSECCYIGDSLSDFHAAEAASVDFFLQPNESNLNLHPYFRHITF
jgi:HAD superfamily hydrolase (TIGR01549 family)